MDNTILVVEDEPDLQEALSLNLQNAGYRVLRAGTVRQADALVNATVPHMVLLDWMLPDTPGLSFARKLRCENRTAAIPIILLTALDGKDTAERATQAGAVALLMKPCNVDSLREEIEAATHA